MFSSVHLSKSLLLFYLFFFGQRLKNWTNYNNWFIMNVISFLLCEHNFAKIIPWSTICNIPIPSHNPMTPPKLENNSLTDKGAKNDFVIMTSSWSVSLIKLKLSAPLCLVTNFAPATYKKIFKVRNTWLT